jgi:hypothetical protein
VHAPHLQSKEREEAERRQREEEERRQREAERERLSLREELKRQKEHVQILTLEKETCKSEMADWSLKMKGLVGERDELVMEMEFLMRKSNLVTLVSLTLLSLPSLA